MADFVRMPKQGLQMTEGTITAWLSGEGDAVQKGEPLFEMETDKNAITIDSPADGILLKIIRPVGDTVPITGPIAIVGAAGEDISALLAECQTASPQKEKAAPGAAVSAVPNNSAVTRSAAPPVRAAGEKILASPRARREAERLGVDLARVGFCAENGMIVESDVLAFASGAQTAYAPTIEAPGKAVTPAVNTTPARSAASLATEGEEGVTVIPYSGMRRAIADNMSASLRGMAQANHKIDVEMSAAVALRKAYKAAGRSLSFNDIVLWNVAQTLAESPNMNALSDEANIYRCAHVHLGVAVAVDNGLIVPTLRNADKMSFAEIREETLRLAERAKSGKLTKPEYSGGTFTVTNLGMFGLDEFVAIINPPQVGILAVGAIKERAVVRDGQIVVRPMMTLTLTYDHRAIDGAPAAEFLKNLKIALETERKIEP